jgi:hypothetical protein
LCYSAKKAFFGKIRPKKVRLPGTGFLGRNVRKTKPEAF